MSRASLTAIALLLALTSCNRRRDPEPARYPPSMHAGPQPPTAQPAPGPALQPASPVAHAPAPHGDGYPGSAPAFQRGKASYYHDALAGNRTACGDVYDPRLLTAAHRKLRFGTIIDVVRSDGRWVRVRVNDRGPFVKGRVVDVSRRAAELIGLIQPGVADVRIYVVAAPAN